MLRIEHLSASPAYYALCFYLAMVLDTSVAIHLDMPKFFSNGRKLLLIISKICSYLG